MVTSWQHLTQLGLLAGIRIAVLDDIVGSQGLGVGASHLSLKTLQLLPDCTAHEDNSQ